MAEQVKDARVRRTQRRLRDALVSLIHEKHYPAIVVNEILERADVVVADRTGTIVLINAAAERLFGYTRAELVGQRIETLAPDASSARHVNLRDGYLRKPAVRAMGGELELWGRRKDGTHVPVEISLSPLESSDGLLVVAAVRDISDRRQAERNLKDSEERLTAAARGANIGLWDVDPRTGDVLINEIFETQLGYPPLRLRESDGKWAKLRGGLDAWVKLLHGPEEDPVGFVSRLAGFLEHNESAPGAE